MEDVYEFLREFSDNVVNIVQEYAYIVNNVNNVDNVVNNVNNVNSNNTFVNDIVHNSVLQAVLETWASEALKELQQIFEANGE